MRSPINRIKFEANNDDYDSKHTEITISWDFDSEGWTDEEYRESCVDIERAAQRVAGYVARLGMLASNALLDMAQDSVLRERVWSALYLKNHRGCCTVNCDTHSMTREYIEPPAVYVQIPRTRRDSWLAQLRQWLGEIIANDSANLARARRDAQQFGRDGDHGDDHPARTVEPAPAAVPVVSNGSGCGSNGYGHGHDSPPIEPVKPAPYPDVPRASVRPSVASSGPGNGVCTRCGAPTPEWVLAGRDGKCIGCNQVSA